MATGGHAILRPRLSVADVTVTLTADEALVLFEMLHRWEDADAIDPVLMPGDWSRT